MSSNPSWKKSNQNKNFKNVKIDILDYEDGKWKNISTSQTIGSIQKTTKKVVQTIENQNVIVGISTNQPFSKLSLGDNEGKTTDTSGSTQKIASVNTTANTLFQGETSTIALQEKNDGKNLHGLTYLEELKRKTINTGSTTQNTGIGISVNDVNTDPENNGCAIYIDSQKCVTINSIPRNLDNTTLSRASLTASGSGNDVTPDIKLDVNGSIRVDGFISFIPKCINASNITTTDKLGLADSYNQDTDITSQNNAFSEYLTNRSTYNFPKGAIFVANVNNGTKTEPKLFIISETGEPTDLVGTITLEDISTDSGTTTGGLSSITWNHGVGTGTTAELRYQYGGSLNSCKNIFDYRGGSIANVNKSSFLNEWDLPDNIITAKGGNVVILSDKGTIDPGTGANNRSNAELKAYNSGSGLKPITDQNKKIMNPLDDYNKSDIVGIYGTSSYSFTPSTPVGSERGGNLWVERQITIGPNNNNRLLAMIDIEGDYEGIPGINIGETQVSKATNSIIIGNHQANEEIGTNIDTMNSIVMGKNTKIDINTSLIGGTRNTVFGMTPASNRNIAIVPLGTDISPYHHNSIGFGNNNN